MSKCQDSGTQILRPVTNGTAWCGCCGQTVTATTRPGDANQIQFYADHIDQGGFWKRYAEAARREESAPMPNYLELSR